ncbi:hypothetical protein [Kumtagia ephedrae]|uniref:Uncharacterized protein n=1 Tax=Kumtagia ephedrae TaxID=2116701 RepID=A0A2P7SQU1_9HYPH|nr:hypothetical protein [Mesorhizobium ephedrae]PSJ64864.1 hypothetical protein C7I84_04330 [Mesorhizobium ephedrae]
MNVRVLSKLLVLFIAIAQTLLLSTVAEAKATRWIRLDRVAAFSKNMRSFGHHGLVTGVECGMINRRPSVRFTYEFVDKPVFYRYAWSITGEEEFRRRARKAFKPDVKVLTCSIGEFHYGTQNLR